MPDRPRHTPPVQVAADQWRYQSCFCARLHGYTLRLPAPRMLECGAAGCHPPRRVQLHRSKGWRIPPWAVSVARPTRWGNPYRVGSVVLFQDMVVGHHVGGYSPAEFWAELPVPGGLTASQAVALYRAGLVDNLADPEPIFDDLRDALRRLAGWDLACWCPLQDGQGNVVPCHADVLLQFANGETR